MSSFFEKLKKGMGADVSEKEISKKSVVLPKVKTIVKQDVSASKLSYPSDFTTPQKVKKPKIENKSTEVGMKEIEKQKIKKTENKKPVAPEKDFLFSAPDQVFAEKRVLGVKEKWFEPKGQSFAENLGGQEGQLAIDFYQAGSELIVRAAIAGIKPEDIDISIESDSILIKGKRAEPLEIGEKKYFYQECHWGPFSRKIILPEDTDPGHAEASMKDGILIIKIPKIEKGKKKKIVVR